MITHILSIDEYKAFVSREFLGVDDGFSDTENIEQLTTQCKSWDLQLGGLHCFLSIILEIQQKKGINSALFIEKIKEYENLYNFNTNGISENLLNILFESTRNSNLTLHDELIETMHKMLTYEF